MIPNCEENKDSTNNYENPEGSYYYGHRETREVY